MVTKEKKSTLLTKASRLAISCVSFYILYDRYRACPATQLTIKIYRKKLMTRNCVARQLPIAPFGLLSIQPSLFAYASPVLVPRNGRLADYMLISINKQKNKRSQGNILISVSNSPDCE